MGLPNVFTFVADRLIILEGLAKRRAGEGGVTDKLEDTTPIIGTAREQKVPGRVRKMKLATPLLKKAQRGEDANECLRSARSKREPLCDFLTRGRSFLEQREKPECIGNGKGWKVVGGQPDVPHQAIIRSRWFESGCIINHHVLLSLSSVGCYELTHF